MMFLKRLAAIVLTLIILINLAACNQKSPSNSANDSLQVTSKDEIYSENTSASDNQNTDNLSQENSKEEAVTDNASTSNNQTLDNLYQDSSKNETSTDDTSTGSNQVSDNSQEAYKDESSNNTDDTSTRCNHGTNDPYQGISKAEFYADYKVACCNWDAKHRSQYGFLSGALEVPGQYAQEAGNRPKSDEMFIRNTATIYLDNGNTYVVMNADGNEVMRIHKAGGYITIEEVAAYMYAFGGSGQIPANYISKKSGKPNSSIWGEHLRVNHSYFIGDTDRYPYEPELPNISGCGGSLRYYEMDIGTTGTTTPGYAAKPYIQGNKINRGAARLVYTRQDLNGNGSYESNEVYVFYTHNHYNDFREYLNYYGGWGEMFGNVTGGGEYSGEHNVNPTPYVPTDYADFSQ